MPELLYPGNIPMGVLQSPIGVSGTLTFNVSGWPATIGGSGQNFIVEVGSGLGDDEKIALSSFTGGNTATIAGGGRGWDSTTAAAHSVGEQVRLVWDSTSAQDLADHVYLTGRDNHTQYLNVARHDLTARHGSAVVIHGLTGSLGADDHPQYARTDGTRAITGAQTFNAGITVTGAATVSAALTAQTVDPTGITGALAAGRYVGNTVTGAPTTGTFLVGDTVVDNTGALFVCLVAGTPGTWSVPVGGLVAAATGPVGQTDYVATPATVFTQAAALINGAKYLINMTLLDSSQITTAGQSSIFLNDSAGYIPGGGSPLRVLQWSVPAGGAMAGGTSFEFTATATATDTFTMSAQSSAGALRIPANFVQFNLTRVA